MKNQFHRKPLKKKGGVVGFIFLVFFSFSFLQAEKAEIKLKKVFFVRSLWNYNYNTAKEGGRMNTAKESKKKIVKSFCFL